MLKKRTLRRAQRYPVNLPVAELNGRQVAGTFVVDLSSLGARIEATAPLSTRNHVEMTISLPDQEPLVLSGQVAWLRPMVNAPGRFQMGVCFFNPQWDLDSLGRRGKL